jgi:hypothetical protein
VNVDDAVHEETPSARPVGLQRKRERQLGPHSPGRSYSFPQRRSGEARNHVPQVLDIGVAHRGAVGGDELADALR